MLLQYREGLVLKGMSRAKKGFTLLEVVVATIILALVMGGLGSLFFGAKRWILHARARMQATEVSKRFLDSLQMNVRYDQWNPPNGANCLASNGAGGCPGAEGLDNITYTPQYTITSPGGADGRREVTITITWNENVW